MLRDVRYGPADGGEHVAEGLTVRAEGQLSPMSGISRRPGWLLFGRVHGPLSRLEVSPEMQKFSLEALGHQLLERAGAAGGGHAADTVVGGHERILRQTVIAMVKGAVLAEHENPGEATVHVLRGRVRLSAGDLSWEGRSGDLLVVPDARHSLEALEASAMLLTVVKAP